MDRRTDGWMEPLKTIYPFGTSYAGGIIMPIILISIYHQGIVSLQISNQTQYISNNTYNSDITHFIYHQGIVRPNIA